jgi:hypothetical protein
MVTARASPEDRRNFRRFNFFMVPNCKLDYGDKASRGSL